MTGKQTKYELSEVIINTFENEDNLKSEEHKKTKEEQQSKVKMKCNFCDRTVSGENWPNQENSRRHKMIIKKQSRNLTQVASSSQIVRSSNN